MIAHAQARARQPGRARRAIEYDQYVADLVNYLAYMAEPAQTDRKFWGIIVLFFLAALRRARAAAQERISGRTSNAEHDDALLGDHRSLQPPLPDRALRKGHGFRDHRRGPHEQARGPRGDEPVQPHAGAGRARPGALRVEHHQRVHRRALPAPAADAGGPGDARPRAALPVPLRAGALQPRPDAGDRAPRRRRRRRACTSART